MVTAARHSVQSPVRRVVTGLNEVNVFSGRKVQQVHDRFGNDPRDLRHSLTQRKGDTQDVRKNLVDREDDGGDYKTRFGSAPYFGSPEDRDRERDQRFGHLPDFAQRPEKYGSEDWQARPEMTPRGSYYFEHDDRESGGGQWGLRGRGYHQQRVPFRGNYYGGRFRGRWTSSNYRGRGFNRGTGGFRPMVNYGRGRSGQGGVESWKHDKFEITEEEPSSTTNK